MGTLERIVLLELLFDFWNSALLLVVCLKALLFLAVDPPSICGLIKFGFFGRF
jgi:hypothetical protein